MFPPIDDHVLENNPDFAKLYKTLTTSVLNPDGTSKRSKDAKENASIRQVHNPSPYHSLPKPLLTSPSKPTSTVYEPQSNTSSSEPLLRPAPPTPLDIPPAPAPPAAPTPTPTSPPASPRTPTSPSPSLTCSSSFRRSSTPPPRPAYPPTTRPCSSAARRSPPSPASRPSSPPSSPPASTPRPSPSRGSRSRTPTRPPSTATFPRSKTTTPR